jgi:hypothetical protein
MCGPILPPLRLVRSQSGAFFTFNVQTNACQSSHFYSIGRCYLNASKETAREAFAFLEGQKEKMNEVAFQNIREFVIAAMKRLPTEAAIAKDKERKKSYHRKKTAGQAEKEGVE